MRLSIDGATLGIFQNFSVMFSYLCGYEAGRMRVRE